MLGKILYNRNVEIKKIKKKRPKALWAKRVLVVFVIAVTLGTTFLLGYASGLRGVNLGATLPIERIVNKNTGKPADVDFSTFWEAWNKLNENYVGKVDPTALIQGAISGMLAATKDPYTVYLKPEDNQRFMSDISGQFDGIGVEITQVDSMPTVVAPLPDSPAEKAGLKAKDVISEVDGTKTADMAFDDVINKIRGQAGSQVTLTVVRSGSDQPLKIVVTREKITVASVTTEVKNYQGKQYYYIKVRQFGDDTSTLFAKAAGEVQKNNYAGIILDLRNDPGGYLETAVDLGSYFVDGGIVVSEVDRNGNKQESKTTHSATLKNYKLAVLINDGSASASEILAGAIKDRKQGTIIGQKSFGKGSVQILEELSDKSAVKITVAKWLTPNGGTIDGVGIEPDVKIDNKDAIDTEYINKALEILSK